MAVFISVSNVVANDAEFVVSLSAPGTSTVSRQVQDGRGPGQ